MGAGREAVHAAQVKITVSEMLIRLDKSGATVSQNAVAARPTSTFMITISTK